jgi:16S rRNA (guanine1207-N2)-methyltransferase
VSEHYFSESPAGDFSTRTIDVMLMGERRQMVTAGSVFSPEHLDRGTEVLLRTIEQAHADEESGDSSGPILDLGCGWGPIALSAALSDPSRVVWAVDVNARARTLTETNASRLGLDNVRVVAPEDVPESLQFNEIHSNPPIRIGKEALHAMLRHWLPRLADRGVAYLVVAKHLGAESLQKWIAAEFPSLHVSRRARDKGFHVIEASR